MKKISGRGWCGCDEGYEAAAWTFPAGSKDRTLAVADTVRECPFPHPLPPSVRS